MRVCGFLSKLEKAVLQHMLDDRDYEPGSVDLDSFLTDIPEELASELRDASKHPMCDGPIRAFVYYQDIRDFFWKNRPLLRDWILNLDPRRPWMWNLCDLSSKVGALNGDEFHEGWNRKPGDPDEEGLGTFVQTEIVFAVVLSAVLSMLGRVEEKRLYREAAQLKPLHVKYPFTPAELDILRLLKCGRQTETGTLIPEESAKLLRRIQSCRVESVVADLVSRDDLIRIFDQHREELLCWLVDNFNHIADPTLRSVSDWFGALSWREVLSGLFGLDEVCAVKAKQSAVLAYIDKLACGILSVADEADL